MSMIAKPGGDEFRLPPRTLFSAHVAREVRDVA
jgi:hypothetical protein